MSSVTTNSCSNLNMAGFNIFGINTISSSFAVASSMTLANLNMNGGTISNVNSFYAQNFGQSLNLTGNNIINVQNITATVVTASTIVANIFSGTLLGSVSKLNPGAYINNQLFDGTSDINIDTGLNYASSLVGITLAANVIYSSLQTVGNLTSLTMAGTLNLTGNNVVNVTNITSSIVTTSTLIANNITTTFATIDNLTSDIFSTSTITAGNITATIGTIPNFTSSTITANNITATLVTGNFSSDEFISYPTGTLSINVINSIVVSGNRYSPWGTRVGGNSTSTVVGNSVGLNNLGDIVTVGFYSATPVLIYNAGGTIAGFTMISSGSDDVYIVKWDSLGTAQWASRVAGTLSDSANAVAINDAGFIYVAGRYASAPVRLFNAGGVTVALTLNNIGSNDVFIAAYDAVGTVRWGTRVAGSLSDNATGIASNSTDVVITGFYSSSPFVAYNSGGIIPALTLNNAGGIDTFVVKYDSNGILQWGTRIAGIGTDQGISTDITNDGNIVVMSQSNATVWVYNWGGTTIQFTLSTSGDYDMFIVKYNSLGTPQWVSKVGGTSLDGGGSSLSGGVSVNDTGDIVMTGYYNSSPVWVYNAGGTTIAFTLFNSGDSDAFIVKYNTNGIAQWATRIAGIGADIGNEVAMNNTGDIIVAGQFNTIAPLYIYNADGTTAFSLAKTTSVSDTFIVKYNSYGVAQWGAEISGTNNNQAFCVAMNDIGDIVVTGYYDTSPISIYNSGGTFEAYTLPNSGNRDAFIVKYTDEINLSLPNPNENGQEKSIKSLGPKVIVTPSGYINNSTASITIYNGDLLNLVWDSTNSNWYLRNSVKNPVTNELVWRSNGLESLKISSTGQVSTPYNCAFLATYSRNTISGPGVASTNTKLIFTYKLYDINNNYNTTTGVFTAPVTGLYYISCNATIISTSSINTVERLFVYLNNYPFIEIQYDVYSNTVISGNRVTAPLYTSLMLTSGDQITIYLNLSNGGLAIEGFDPTYNNAISSYFACCLLA